ncbi:MAG: hypothetical protein ACFB6R_01500 [Alphaproteobacteria bacterium]
MTIRTHPFRSEGLARTALVILTLAIAGCGRGDRTESTEPLPSLSAFEDRLLAATRRPGDTPRAAAMEKAVLAAFAALDAEPAPPLENDPAADITGLAVVPGSSALCASPSMDRMAPLGERLTSAATAIGDALEACLSGCPAVSCETYKTSIIAAERSTSTAQALSGRLAGAAVADDEAVSARLIRWRSDALKAAADGTALVLKTAGQASQGAWDRDGTRFRALSALHRRLAAEGARLIWDRHLDGPDASAAVAALEEAARVFGVLAAYASPAGGSSDRNADGEGNATAPGLADALAGPFARALADAGIMVLSAGARLEAFALGANPGTDTEASDACLLPVSRTLAAVPRQMAPLVPRLKACAKAKGCTQRPALSLDMFENARLSPEDGAERFDEEANALEPAAQAFRDADCD